jgi:hypothetical protein
MGDPAHKLSGRKGPPFRNVGVRHTDRRTEPTLDTIIVKPKVAREIGADRKESGSAISKSDAIRQMARELVSKGQPPRPKDIVTELRKKGIVVLSSQVSTALRDTEFALRQLRVDWDSPPVLFPEPALALRQVSIDDVNKARDFVCLIGSLEKAMAALVALGQFGGEQATATEQTKSQTAADGRSSEKESAMRLTS